MHPQIFYKRVHSSIEQAMPAMLSSPKGLLHDC